MSGMRRPDYAVLILTASIIAADAISFQMWLATRSTASQVILSGLLYAQNGLLWVWACLGATRASLRFSTALIGTTVILLILAGPHTHSEEHVLSVAAHLFGDAAGICAVSIGFRLEGLRLAAKQESSGGSRSVVR
jgi:hypothetical protein